MDLRSEIIEVLACPACKTKLDKFECRSCDITFPLVEQIPVLINEADSLFKIADFTERTETTYKAPTKWKTTLKALVPSISININAAENLGEFFANLAAENTGPRVLVIGGAVSGKGFSSIPKQVTLVETDVAFGPRTSLICDAHDLPFLRGSFDGVIAQVVLEHVLDPAQCVAEIHRVLKKDGVVYAETPFMQQVHSGRYDFSRFSHLGHRYLFRHFSEINSGPTCGPAMVLAWTFCYFLQSFFRNKTLGQMAFFGGSFAVFWLKYLDYFLIKKPNAYDASSCYFFLGRRSETNLSGRELVAGYKGMIY